jgi:lysozyme
MNDKLRLSKAGQNLIKAFESCLRPVGGGRITAYLDPVQVPTIGWGHTNHHGRQFRMGDIWTQAECDEEFRSDMVRFEKAVKQLVKVPLRQWQFDALVSFSFNVGEGALGKSTLLRKVNAGDFEGAALEFQKWNRAGGQVLAGLTRRRASESLLFQNIPDANYDGRPDKVRPPTVEEVPDTEPMPQQVDEPKPPPKTGVTETAVVGGGLSITAIITIVLDKLGDLSEGTLNALGALAAKPYFWVAVACLAAFVFIYWKRRQAKLEAT